MIHDEKSEMLELLNKAMNKSMMSFEKEFDDMGYELTGHYRFEVVVRHFPSGGEDGRKDEDGLLVVKKTIEG